MALTVKQRRFCDEYMKDLNATQAAKRAKYSQKTAYSIGQENLKKPEIKDYIEKKIKELCISADETTKLLSDIGRSSLNNYFTIRKRTRTAKVKMPLSQLIKKIEKEMKMEAEYAFEAQLADKEMEIHLASQESRRRRIIRLKIQLKHNPKAYEIVDGATELVDCAELDLAALVRDKEAGRIKSVKPTEFGLQVEMYSADNALVQIARMHGLFEKDNKQKPGVIVNNLAMSKEEIKRISQELEEEY